MPQVNQAETTLIDEARSSAGRSAVEWAKDGKERTERLGNRTPVPESGTVTCSGYGLYPGGSNVRGCGHVFPRRVFKGSKGQTSYVGSCPRCSCPVPLSDEARAAFDGYARLTFRMANELARQHEGQMDPEEVYDRVVDGGLAAAARFDPENGLSPTTCAIHWMIGRIRAHRTDLMTRGRPEKERFRAHMVPASVYWERAGHDNRGAYGWDNPDDWARDEDGEGKVYRRAAARDLWRLLSRRMMRDTLHYPNWLASYRLRDYKIFLLHHRYGWKDPEIAKRFGVSRERVRQARQEVTERLQMTARAAGYTARDLADV